MIGKSKKLVVPLIAIMMCGVALAGVAYAYTASLNIPGQGPDAADLTIDLATLDPSEDITVVTGDVIVFTDNYVYTALNPAAKTDRVDAYAQNGKTTYDLKVSGEATAAKIVINSSDVATMLATTIGNNVTVGNLITVKANITDDVSTAKVIDNADTAAFTIAKQADADLAVTVYLYFVPVDAVAHTVQPATATGAQGFKDASDFVDDIEGLSFQITFTADSAALA